MKRPYQPSKRKRVNPGRVPSTAKGAETAEGIPKCLKVFNRNARNERNVSLSVFR